MKSSGAASLNYANPFKRQEFMAKSMRTDWVAYWEQFSDLDELQSKSFNLDETLVEIERVVGCKLLSGDQMQIIMALEERIREVSKRGGRSKMSAQYSLFDE
jgi:hypothetical protein